MTRALSLTFALLVATPSLGEEPASSAAASTTSAPEEAPTAPLEGAEPVTPSASNEPALPIVEPADVTASAADEFETDPLDDAPEFADDDPGDDDDRVRVLVMELQAPAEVAASIRRGVSDVMAEALDALGPFKAVSAGDIQRMMEIESEKAALGCSEDSSCLAEIAGALGAAYAIVGSLDVYEGEYLLSIQLLDIASARVVERVSRAYQGAVPGLFETASAAAKAVVREVLRQRSGTVELVVSEEGATIVVDDRTVGTSPMPPMELGGGVHHVVIEKRGYVAAAKDIDVKEGEATRALFTLRPSEEFRRDYATAAWSKVALTSSLALFGTGGLFGAAGFFGASVLYAADVRQRLEAYNAASVRTNAEHSALQQELRLLSALDVVVVGSAVLGLGLLGGALVSAFFLDNPLKYAFIDEDSAVGE